VITLVDDERLGSRWKRLKRLVESVADGQALLEKLETARPDVVLLDLVMPKLDGLQVIRKIRESGNDVPVVVIAAKNAVKAAIKAVKQGAADYIARPFNDEEVLLRVHRALESGREATATLDVPLRELHDPTTGRIDAKKMAAFLAIPLAQLAGALDVPPATVHKTPSAPGLQKGLQPIKRTVDLLSRATRSPFDARAWLNNPHSDLGGRTPMDVILGGQADAVSTLLENAMAGIPS
jgi:FixJ family two-component response regulator